MNDKELSDFLRQTNTGLRMSQAIPMINEILKTGYINPEKYFRSAGKNLDIEQDQTSTMWGRGRKVSTGIGTMSQAEWLAKQQSNQNLNYTTDQPSQNQEQSESTGTST